MTLDVAAGDAPDVSVTLEPLSRLARVGGAVGGPVQSGSPPMLQKPDLGVLVEKCWRRETGEIVARNS